MELFQEWPGDGSDDDDDDDNNDDDNIDGND